MKRHEHIGRAASGAKSLAFVLGGPQERRRGQRGVLLPIRHTLCKNVTVLRTAHCWVCKQRAVVKHYHCSLPTDPEDRSSHLLRGRSLKSPQLQLCFPVS
jgi:hypothetical protein